MCAALIILEKKLFFIHPLYKAQSPFGFSLINFYLKNGLTKLIRMLQNVFWYGVGMSYAVWSCGYDCESKEYALNTKYYTRKCISFHDRDFVNNRWKKLLFVKKCFSISYCIMKRFNVFGPIVIQITFVYEKWRLLGKQNFYWRMSI